MQQTTAAEGTTLEVRPPTEQEVARFVVDTCVELQGLARHPRFEMLRYMLDMARLQAEIDAEETPP